MNENEVAIRNGDDIITVNVDSLPDIISTQIDTISALEKKVNACDASAKKAMDYVSGQMTRYEDKGKWIFKHRSGNTKDIIEDTQEAIDNLASAQQVTAEALRQSFEFQRKLAEASKYLFELGCANVTVNRISVRAIEAKLNGASKKDISELARQEMQAVVKQLKDQEDILKKQEELKAKVKSNVERLNAKDTLDTEQTKQIDNLNIKMSEKDRLDAEQSQRLEELGAMLENKDSVDQHQEEAITQNRSDINVLKSSLQEKNILDDEQSKRISKNEEAIKIIYEFMRVKDELDKAQSKDIEELKSKKAREGLSTAAVVLSTIAIVIGIINIVFQFI